MKKSMGKRAQEAGAPAAAFLIKILIIIVVALLFFAIIWRSRNAFIP